MKLVMLEERWSKQSGGAKAVTWGVLQFLIMFSWYMFTTYLQSEGVQHWTITTIYYVSMVLTYAAPVIIVLGFMSLGIDAYKGGKKENEVSP